MKYAIVESGGKQYKAVEGATIDVDLLPVQPGEKLDLKDVLLISDEDNILVGTPLVDGAKISATVLGQIKAPKIIVFKYKSRQRYRVKQGHRQKYTRLTIDEIVFKGSKKAAAPVKAEEQPEVKAEPKAEAKPKTAAKTKTKTASKTAAKTKTASKTAAKPKTASKTAAKTKTTPKKAATKKSTKKSE